MIAYDVYCYRCKSTAAGVESDETRAREKIEAFKREHRNGCGDATSFSMNIYSTAAEPRTSST